MWHPDRFLNNPRLQQKADEKMKEINQAYEILKDLPSRSGYVNHHKEKRAGPSTEKKSHDRYEDTFDPSKRILCSDGTCIGVVNDKGFCKVCGKPYRPWFS